MKTLVLVTAAALALASVTAYSQTQQQHSHPEQNGPAQTPPTQGDRDRGGPPTMQGGMMQGGMRGGMPGMHQGMQGMHHGMMGAMHGMGRHSAMPRGDNSPSSLAFYGINMKMHDGMDITFTGNADVDFVAGMIPHHQGAIDMAKTVLAFGKDPEVKKLAEQIIKAQESELALLTEWLKKNRP